MFSSMVMMTPFKCENGFGSVGEHGKKRWGARAFGVFVADIGVRF